MERMSRVLDELLALSDGRRRHLYRKIATNVVGRSLASSPLSNSEVDSTLVCCIDILMHLRDYLGAQCPRDVMRTVIGLWKTTVDEARTRSEKTVRACAALVLLSHERSTESKYLTWAVRDGLIPLLLHFVRAEVEQDVFHGFAILIHYIRVLMISRHFVRVLRRYSDQDIRPRAGDPVQVTEFIRDYRAHLAGLDYVAVCTAEVKCWNATCLHTASQHVLKKCAGCWTRYYCSPECQECDWAAGHQRICPIYAGNVDSLHDRVYIHYFASLAVQAASHHIVDNILHMNNQMGPTSGILVCVDFAARSRPGAFQGPGPDIPDVSVTANSSAECMQAAAMSPPRGIVWASLPEGGEGRRTISIGQFDLTAALASGEISIIPYTY
ncbi:hypothetical protein BD626DRAFT_482929 [Schizophyllum amplum]|uniref:MYND-type domain-containing protein n=1 Tax=Schizophyllum amplum TaxID=97359 RepID=A0A550CNZ4_9AGAR|nr:hypothetical protein BD626DRAFT_482929 [Auriculariopsis ampla]